MRRDACQLLQQRRQLLLGTNLWLSSNAPRTPPRQCASRRSLARCRSVRATLSASSSTRNAAASGKEKLHKRSLPYVVYSQNKREVTALDLALLLAASKQQTLLDDGSVQKMSYFYHWSGTLQGVAGERVLQKLTRALDRSIAVVAAFTNCDVYEGTGLGQLSNGGGSGNGNGSGGGEATGSMDGGPISWNWLRSSSSRAQRKRSLIGFARAAGDGSLAATIYDLAVHPDFRGCGVGTKLLRVLTQQLYYKEVYDIGSVVPAEVQPFFARCGFEEDRELSTTLTFCEHHEWREQGLVHGLLPGPTWLLDPRWSGLADTSSRSSSNSGGGGGKGGAAAGIHRIVGGGAVQQSGSASESIVLWPQQQAQQQQQQGRACTASEASQQQQQQQQESEGAGEGGVRGSPGAAQSWLAMEGSHGDAAAAAGWRVQANWGLPGRNDRLARVPCPATEALQSSVELKQLLERKMDQALLAATEGAATGRRSAGRPQGGKLR